MTTTKRPKVSELRAEIRKWRTENSNSVAECALALQQRDDWQTLAKRSYQAKERAEAERDELKRIVEEPEDAPLAPAYLIRERDEAQAANAAKDAEIERLRGALENIDQGDAINREDLDLEDPPELGHVMRELSRVYRISSAALNPSNVNVGDPAEPPSDSNRGWLSPEEAEQLQEEIERLRGALAPFATYYHAALGRAPGVLLSRRLLPDEPWCGSGDEVNINAQHFAAARTALNPSEQSADWQETKVNLDANRQPGERELFPEYPETGPDPLPDRELPPQPPKRDDDEAEEAARIKDGFYEL